MTDDDRRDKRPRSSDAGSDTSSLDRPLPPNDPPSGDMRPLDVTHPPGTLPLDAAASRPGESGVASPFDVQATGPADAASSGSSAVPSPVPADAPTQPTGPASTTGSGEEPILPAAYDEGALREAVGAPPPRPKRKRKDDGDDGARDTGAPASRRTVAIAAVAIVVGLAIAALVFLGRANSQRYAIACSTDKVSAEQGRAFPPWGTQALTGPEWKSIALPPNAECKPRETEDVGELERWYLDLLMDRASTTLTTRNLLDSLHAGGPNPLDQVTAQLHQALLLSRSPDRRDQRKEVERLLGDVQYWRASLRLREASAALLDAASQFEAAAAQRPRHVTDASAWAEFLRRLTGELSAGPNGAPADPAVPGAAVVEPPREPAPAGTALPVEPEPQDSASEPVAPPDAGLPSGGVLL